MPSSLAAFVSSDGHNGVELNITVQAYLSVVVVVVVVVVVFSCDQKKLIIVVARTPRHNCFSWPFCVSNTNTVISDVCVI